MLGMNIAPAADPAALAATGAKIVRCVYRDWLPPAWVEQLVMLGVEVLLVGDSSPDSLGDDESQWRPRMEFCRQRFGASLKYIQWGNEPDGTGIASWTMDHARVNRLLGVARDVFPYRQYTLIGPGLVSGQPEWAQGLALHLVDALSAHPYAKGCQTADARRELNYMLNGYLALGKPLWATEFDSRTRGLAAYLRNYPGVQAAITMCWDDGQTESTEGIRLGLKQNPDALREFLALTGGTYPLISQPASVAPRYQMGFRDWHDADPGLLGEPLEDERGGIPGFSVQKTSKGRLMAANLADRGWTLTFWADTGERWLLEDGRSRMIG